MSDTQITLIVADDQSMVRGGLAALLDLEPDIAVVGQAATGPETLALIRELRPDVALVDIEMPGASGLEVAEEIHADDSVHTRILIVTTFGRTGYLRRALDAGVGGFMVKDSPAEELAVAVRKIHSGLRVVDPELATQSLLEGENPLTEREQQILRMAGEGKAVSAMAKALFLSPGTVRNHLSSAIAKTHSMNKTEAARVAEERGWL